MWQLKWSWMIFLTTWSSTGIKLLFSLCLLVSGRCASQVIRWSQFLTPMIPISHSDNKCQITAVLAAIMKGEYLPKSIINEKHSNVTHNLTFLRGGTSGIWRITGQMKTLCIAILRRLLFHLLKRGLLLSCPPHSSAYSVWLFSWSDYCRDQITTTKEQRPMKVWVSRHGMLWKSKTTKNCFCGPSKGRHHCSSNQATLCQMDPNSMARFGAATTDCHQRFQKGRNF